jgi:hypothetical protein
MKIRAIIGFAGNDFNFYEGEVQEVSEALGKSLIKDGLAEEVKPEGIKKAPVKPKK